MTSVLPLSNNAQGNETPGLSNIEAEQSLLGCVMYDNAAYERVPDSLKAVDFYEPFHARLWAAMEDAIRKGQLAEPIVLMERFRNDPAFEELGGLRYLANLVDTAPPAFNAPDLARVVHGLAIRRAMVRIGGDIAGAAATDHDSDERELIEAAETALYELAEAGQQEVGTVNFANALSGAVMMYAEAFNRDGGLSGLSTGLIDLDRKLGGLHPSDLLVIAARPSMGKTSLATNIAFHVARNYQWEKNGEERRTVSGGVVAFYSLEMSAEQLAGRILAEVSGISGDRLRKGEFDAAEYARIRDTALEIESAPLFIDATGGLSLAKLAARARRTKRKHGLDLIVVDYIQLLTQGGKENRTQEVTAITGGLKALAKELNVPVIALSQLSRQVESRQDKRPMLSDLRESGSIEQDADIVMFLYREAYYVARTEPKEGSPEHLTWQDEMAQVRGVAECIVAKQRHGPIGTVKLSFDEDLTKFGNLAREGRYERAANDGPKGPRYSYGGDE